MFRFLPNIFTMALRIKRATMGSKIGNFLKIDGVVEQKDCECEKRTAKKDPCSKKIKEQNVPVLKIDQVITTKKVNEEDLIELVKLAPVIVSLKATNELKAHRGEGIFYGPKTSKKAEGDHVVLVTGYGTENGEHYWKIQNSWGVGWGERGFAKLAVAKTNILFSQKLSTQWSLQLAYSDPV